MNENGNEEVIEIQDTLDSDMNNDSQTIKEGILVQSVKRNDGSTIVVAIPIGITEYAVPTMLELALRNSKIGLGISD